MAEPVIEFSSKELFLEINRKIDVLTEMSHSKADNSRVERLETEIREKLNRLEKETATAEAVRSNESRLEAFQKTSRQQWISIVVAFILGLGGLVVELFKVVVK